MQFTLWKFVLFPFAFECCNQQLQLFSWAQRWGFPWCSWPGALLSGCILPSARALQWCYLAQGEGKGANRSIYLEAGASQGQQSRAGSWQHISSSLQRHSDIIWTFYCLLPKRRSGGEIPEVQSWQWRCTGLPLSWGWREDPKLIYWDTGEELRAGKPRPVALITLGQAIPSKEVCILFELLVA